MSTHVGAPAATKLLVGEVESDALMDKLQERRTASEALVSSWLLHTELHCAASRRPEDVAAGAVEALLSALTLVDVEPADLVAAPLFSAVSAPLT